MPLKNSTNFFFLIYRYTFSDFLYGQSNTRWTHTQQSNDRRNPQTSENSLKLRGHEHVGARAHKSKPISYLFLVVSTNSV